MKTEFVLYELALELKQLGFDEPCFGFYDESLYFPNNENQYGTFCNQILDTSSCSAPLYQQAFRWFREKYKLSGLIEIGTQEYSFFIFNESEDSREVSSNINGSYEEAELECLKKLIEIVKNK